MTDSVWRLPEDFDHIKVKPLDVERKDGWTDGKGDFCLPLSEGYYIKFPKKDGELFGLYLHNDLISAASQRSDILQIAQDHHRYRIVTSLAEIPSKADTLALDILGRMHKAATELAMFASYAESVGAVTHNGEPIKKWSAEIFKLHHEYAVSGLVDKDVAMGLAYKP